MDKKLFLSVTASVLVAVGISLGAVLVFSLIVTATGLPDSFIRPINYVIKLLSLCIGCVVFSTEGKGLLRGAFVGLFYFLLANVIFALIAADFSLSVSLLIDLSYCLIVGAVAGVLAVNLKKK